MRTPLTTDPHPPTRARLVAAYLVIYLVWGSTYLFIKMAVAHVPPLLAGALRHGSAGAALFLWARAHGARTPTWREWGVAVLVGALLLGFGNGMVNVAVQRVPSGLAALVVSSVPIWMVIVEWCRPRGSAPRGRVVVGLVLGMIGIGALVWSAGGLGGSVAATAATVWSCGAFLVGSLSWAVGSIAARHLRRHPHSLLSASMEMSSAGVLLLAASALSGETRGFTFGSVSATSWWALGYLIAFGSIVGFTSYTWLLRVSTPAKVATYAYVNPLVAVALGAAFGGERLSRGTLVAAALILGAVVMITLPPRAALRQVFRAR